MFCGDLLGAFCECVCSVLVQRMRDPSTFAAANLHLAVRLQSDLIIQAIL